MKKKLRNFITVSVLLIFIFGFSHAFHPFSAKNSGTNIGDMAPEISLLKPDSSMLSLSSFKGYVVLVDFWASWCGPCRRTNPSKVQVFNEYKDKAFKDAKGFVIFSVSLDRNYFAWTNAIESDNLYWANHVSDLKAWESVAASTYKVNSIPANFLLNQNGVLIAKNLRGVTLNEKLNELLE